MLRDFTKDNAQAKLMLARFDEVLSDKVNKNTLQDFKQALKEKYETRVSVLTQMGELKD